MPNLDDVQGPVSDFIINNVILPPKLPQHECSLSRDGEMALLIAVESATIDFVTYLVLRSPYAYELPRWTDLTYVFQSHTPMLDTIALHLRAQNAGLLIHVEDTSTVLFDAFEASPTNDEVMATQGRLIRAFPGSSVQVPLAVLQDAHFRQDFAASLRRLNDEEVAAMMPITNKARSEVVEIRDTAHPGLVTEYLMNLLAAVGRFQKGGTIIKCTRDDVLWHNSKLPWTRSPFWLVLRVALQKGLVRAFPDDAQHSHYKNFMLFFVTKLSNVVSIASKPAETLSNINSKLARRAAKLGSRVFPFVMRRSLDAARMIRRILEKVWHDLQLSETTPIVPFSLLVTNDQGSSLNLANSRIALERAMSWKHGNRAPMSFKPKHFLRMQLTQTDLPSLSKPGTDEDMLLLLSDFEVWVEHRLDLWIATRGAQADDCTRLCSISSSCLSHALSFYASSPREMSLAILTIFELWVALDKLCLMLLPLLGQFPPELDPQMLEVLLVPQLRQMQRLCKVENYLLLRAKRALLFNTRIFEDPTSRSFGVQFYDISTHHQKLKETIEDAARSTRLQKLSEWQAMTSKHQALKNRATSLTHFEEQVEEDGDMVHRPNKCERCKLETRAKSMTIVVHEWPLPSDIVQLKTAVFELDCPEEFIAWRDTTWMILQDLGRHKEGIKHASNLHVRLRSYKQLATHIDRDTREPRITLGSCTKSFLVSHYKSPTFPVSADQVCVNNGLQYKLLDSECTAWVVDQNKSHSFKDFCVLKLRNGPYQTLHWALRTTSHAPNEIISKQDDCPSTMELREFIEFGSLRAGERLQWLNILRELGSSNLTFNEEAVHTLITQAAWEAGSPLEESVTREAHAPLNDDSFCHKLLAMLERLLSTIEANWKEQNTMLTIVAVSLRVLSLTPTTDVSVRCQRLLRRTRDITLGWCQELTLKSTEGVTKHEVEKMRTSVLRAALTCRETYSVDEPHIPELLSSDADVAALIESCIFARDNASGAWPSLSQQELLRGAKTCHALEERLRSLIVSSGKGISLAISNRCGSVLMEHRWTFPEAWGERWGIVTTARSASRLSQTIHYDLLTGELLVDGRPLGRLPNEYAKEPVYFRLFGECVLQVSASDMEGMEYMTTRKFSGHQVHFGIINGSLIIKARLGDSTLETIPHNVFTGDLPTHFVDAFVHWLDISTGVVEFRPLDTVWETCSSNWRLAYSALIPATMRLAHRELLDLSCAHSQWGLEIVARLEEKSFVHITRADDGLIEVDLPRLSLRFFLNSGGYLQSRDFGDIVDPNQSLGTLCGLKRRLVLCGPDLRTKCTSRSVLIPYGDISIEKAGAGIQVSIDTDGAQRRIQVFRYHLDYVLRKLRGPPDLLSTLYKAYLHGLTSFVVVDPFTGRIGTEEALSTLRETALRTCRPLEADHEDFCKEALAIKTSADRCSLLYDTSLIVRTSVDLNRGSVHLLERAAKRAGNFRNATYGGNATKSEDDRLYQARDGAGSCRGERVYSIASLIKEWPSRVNVTPDLRSVVRQWRKVSGYHVPFRQHHYTDLLSLDMPSMWGSLYDVCRSSRRESSTYSLMFRFCVIAFAEDKQTILRTLLCFAFTDRFRELQPPKSSAYDVLDAAPDDKQLREVIRLWARPCPFSSLAGLTIKQRSNRIATERSAHQREVERQANPLQKHLKDQWPTGNPRLSPDLHLSHLRGTEATVACAKKFAVWHENWRFGVHVAQVQAQLESVHCESTVGPAYVAPKRTGVLTPTPSKLVGITDLLSTSKPRKLDEVPALGMPVPAALEDHQRDVSKLEATVSHFMCHHNSVQKQQDRVLQDSMRAFKCYSPEQLSAATHPSLDALEHHQQDFKKYVEDIFNSLSQSLGPTKPHLVILQEAGLWPRITPQSLLETLAAKSEHRPNEQWKRALLHYGESMATLQRAERLVALKTSQDTFGLAKELQNKGRQGWCAYNYPDWLLLELENNFTIRAIQARVALEMISPSSSDNTVLQLNMGEGKSSVIIPMVAAALANGKQLVRVVVLKPLLRQTEDLLAQRLGGLLNRRIYHTPFSRKTHLTTVVVQQLQTIFEECRSLVKKLSASGWDLPAVAGCPVTTGFSGTNDNRFLLPLSIRQHDLPELHHTNSMVLDHLLRNENSKYACIVDEDGKKISIESFLGLISRHNPPIRVLIDVGAQVLKMTNREVAQEWLRHASNTKAAVFFSNNDEKMVIDRTGYLSLLSKSPYQDCLQDCVVYLDEVHTRGIDLKIPVGTQAAVTLGPRLTKDRLVQDSILACMRMRKLGSGHTLAFFAPPDVNRSILDMASTNIAQQLNSTDVVRWCIEQTCLVTESVMPLWIMQGLAFCERDRLCRSLLGGPEDLVGNLAEGKVRQFWTDIQEPEARTLRELYDLEDGQGKDDDDVAEESDAGSMLAKLREARKAMVATAMKDCTMNEEQEREVAHEIQRERQIQRPLPAPHYAHVLRPQVVDFVTSGITSLQDWKDSCPIQLAFKTFRTTSAAEYYWSNTACTNVLATRDFLNTVQISSGSPSDDFLRPVRWALTSTMTDDVLLISPYEANELIGQVRKSDKVTLHVFSPRTTKSMVAMDDLLFYNVTGRANEQTTTKIFKDSYVPLH
ncbi:hypothetical protein BJ546DRAFT_947666 [Cryomyces antarcticus]